MRMAGGNQSASQVLAVQAERGSSAVAIEGRPATWDEIAARYEAGDHLVNAGPEIGLFWASNIQSVETLPKQGLEHAVRQIEGRPLGRWPG